MIYVFSTKWASDQFVEGFVKKREHKIFRSAERPGPNEGIAADRFYRFYWPEWDQKLENVEVAFQGIIRNTHEVYEKCLETNTKFYYFDQPYFFMSGYQPHKKFNDIWYRIIVNNTQKNFISKSQKYKDRYKEICKTTSKGITLKKWRPKGDHILVIPPSYHTAKWYNIDRAVWESNIVAKLKRHTDREIRVRHKYIDNLDVGNKVRKPLEEDLKNCWAMVSWHSMCAVEAVLNGIPSFTSEHSPAKPVSLNLTHLDMIEDPYICDREQWLYSLLGAQFTLKEMQSGYAYEFLKDEK
tara:strand:+ start:28 stop:918 length:891 start_codon:yes stop_codon:yes gene_type:complete